MIDLNLLSFEGHSIRYYYTDHSTQTLLHFYRLLKEIKRIKIKQKILLTCTYTMTNVPCCIFQVIDFYQLQQAFKNSHGKAKMLRHICLLLCIITTTTTAWSHWTSKCIAWIRDWHGKPLIYFRNGIINSYVTSLILQSQKAFGSDHVLTRK